MSTSDNSVSHTAISASQHNRLIA